MRESFLLYQCSAFRYRAVPVIAALVTLVSSPAFAQRKSPYIHSLAPYVPSPPAIVDRMLEMAELKPGETLYDLGCGDGRVLIAAAERFRAKAVGVEISDKIYDRAVTRIAKLGLQDQVKLIHGDLLDVDLSGADVVTIYLMTASNESLRPRLEKYLKPGARVVSHDYEVPGWKPTLVERPEAESRYHMLYLYVMPPVKQ